jgi:hypothetical protein
MYIGRILLDTDHGQEPAWLKAPCNPAQFNSNRAAHAVGPPPSCKVEVELDTQHTHTRALCFICILRAPLLCLQSALESCLQQLLLTHSELLEVNGGQGEPLVLADYVRGQPQL